MNCRFFKKTQEAFYLFKQSDQEVFNQELTQPFLFFGTFRFSFRNQTNGIVLSTPTVLI